MPHLIRAGGYNDLDQMMRKILGDVIDLGDHVDTGHWQAIKGVPQTRTVELRNAVFECQVRPSQGSWASFCRPNLPWAEDQFQERVYGDPVNPGDTYMNWPFYKGNVEKHKEQGAFSHTYAERFWGLFAGREEQRVGFTSRDVVPGEQGWDPNKGIRYRYGDLHDVVDLMRREPYTRQAYLPIFFPEDTGAHHGDRIPCTLGYHFMYRNDRLYCNYFIRSCDAIRHFKDDVYMAGRLVQWILSELDTHGAFLEAVPGTLTLHIPSLHVFQDEVPQLIKKHDLVRVLS